MKKVKYPRAIPYYYLPEPSYWPLMGAVGLFLGLTGLINILHGNWYGHYIFYSGLLLFIYMLYGWFSSVINEGLGGLHSLQMDRTYQWGMIWFIVSEMTFFSAFFGALFYTRFVAVPYLAFGHTRELLWPQFKNTWPLLVNPDPNTYVAPLAVISPWGIPAVNTVLLLSSAVSITWAIWSLKKRHPLKMIMGVATTIILGFSFLVMQVYEYGEAYVHLNLTLHSGIFGTTFYLLTGFHGLHVMVGLMMLTVIFIRSVRGHFDAKHDFALEAVSWYWHFVDAVWLFLFVFVYWL